MSGARAGTVSVGVIGLGYWGPNLARNFNELPGAELKWCCDRDRDRLDRTGSTYPDVQLTGDLEEMLTDRDLDAVVIATDVPSHASLAERAIAAGKHCFVEKPLAQSSDQAQRVMELAEEQGSMLMVGHLLQYHPGVQKLKEICGSGELGEIYYIYSNRLNLGKLRGDENALWSLGAHDISVLLYLLDQEPLEVSANGHAYVQEGIEDVVFCHLRFGSSVSANLHLSWLDPHKARRFCVVGSKRMATFDDMELERKIVIYDKGFDRDYASYGEYITRAGDIWSPRIANDEPLKLECRHFLECVREGKRPLTDAVSGLRVVRVLEALQRSLEADGQTMSLADLDLAGR